MRIILFCTLLTIFYSCKTSKVSIALNKDLVIDSLTKELNEVYNNAPFNPNYALEKTKGNSKSFT
jgi:hypothetical protein